MHEARSGTAHAHGLLSNRRSMADTGSKPEEGSEGKTAEKEKDPILAEINKKIEDAFDIFDHENNKTVDVR